MNPAVAGALEQLAAYEVLEPEADVADLAHLRDTVDALIAGTTRVIVDGGSVLPATGPVAFLRHNTTLSTGAAIAAAAVADVMEFLPLTTGAMERGEVGFSHMALMASAREELGAAFDEAKLLEKAIYSTVTEFRNCVRHAIHAARRRAFVDDEAAGRRLRELKLSPDETGALWLRGWLEPEGASIVRSALEELARKGGADDDRTRGQRLGDALVDLAASGVTTELIVTVPLDTLVEAAGAPAAQTEWGSLLSSETVRRLACDSFVRRLVLDGAGNVIDFGRRRRLFGPVARKAMAARDGHCGFPRCDLPARWCEGHHLTPFSEGGATDVRDGLLLCRRHHHLIHDRGWRLVTDSDTGERKALAPPGDWWNWPAVEPPTDQAPPPLASAPASDERCSIAGSTPARTG